LLGGFPCQDVFRARRGGDGMQGERSGLVHALLGLWDEWRERSAGELMYVFENVDFSEEHHADWLWLHERLRGGAPLVFDAARVGPQHRVRAYWTNLPRRLPRRREDRDLATVLGPEFEPQQRCKVASGPGQERYNVRRRRQRKMPTLVKKAGTWSVDNGATLVVRRRDGQLVFPPVEVQERICGLAAGDTAGEGMSEEDRRQLLGNSIDVAAMAHVLAGV
jgi:site-specific DNA-cytosine methylase